MGCVVLMFCCVDAAWVVNEAQITRQIVAKARSHILLNRRRAAVHIILNHSTGTIQLVKFVVCDNVVRIGHVDHVAVVVITITPCFVVGVGQCFEPIGFVIFI